MGLKSYIADKIDEDQSSHGPLGSYLRDKISTALSPKAEPDAYLKGGTVRKSGMAKVHKGEKVLTKAQAKQFGKKR